MAFTEFCCKAGGSNLNAGTRTGSSTEPGTSPDFTYAGTFSTNTFTVSAGDPSADGVAVNDFVQVSDGSAIGRIARITSVTSTTIVLSTTATVGSGTGATVANIGGAWAGPSGTTSFPFNTVTSSLTDASLNRARVNLKNDQQYSITSGITHSVGFNLTMRFQGYTSAYGDGGKATIDGGTSGASYVLLSLSGVATSLEDIIFQNNGATGSASLVDYTAGGNAFGIVRRCVFAHSRGNGFNLGQGGNSTRVVECEAYDCNQSNTAGLGGFSSATQLGGTYIRCISHDHTAGTNAHGFVFRSSRYVSCIADTCGGSGFHNGGNSSGMIFTNCDSYNNGLHGLVDPNIGGGNVTYIVENCNFVKNGTSGTGYGINFVSAVSLHAFVFNPGFGAGTQANATGETNISTVTDIVNVIDPVTYASDVTPWADPASGDFRITLPAAKAAGRGAFTQTASGYAGTVAYPDIGAAQHKGFFARVLRLFEGYTIKFYNGKIILHQK